MKIEIEAAETGILVDAEIKEARPSELPSIHDGWRFNFSKHAKLKHAKAYVIVTRDMPKTIEGALIFQMKEGVMPYMAFVEKAPHNKGKGAKWNRVAECLIAFACRLSFKLGKGDHKGWLTFDVGEEREKDALRLMAMYSQKYHAVRVDETTMLIQPRDGQVLIDKYLE